MITIHIDDQDPTLLAVFFLQDPIGNDLIRAVAGRRWSYSRRCWLVPNTRESIIHLDKLFGRNFCRFDEALVRLYKPAATPAEIERATNPVWPPVSHQSPARFIPPQQALDHHPVITAIRDALRIGNYSYKTWKNYRQALMVLNRYNQFQNIDELTKSQYQRYLLYLIQVKKYSSATVNVHINAWKFYCEKVLLREKEFYDVAYPRQPHKLPTVYSVAEVRAIFQATTSLKYRTLFQLVYATGLRLSEVPSFVCLTWIGSEK